MKINFFEIKKDLNLEETYRELYFAARDCLIESGIYKSKCSVHLTMLRKIKKKFNVVKLPSNTHKGLKRNGYKSYNKKSEFWNCQPGDDVQCGVGKNNI